MKCAQVKDVLLGGALDPKQLQLKEGQAWRLFLDIYVLDADGCIFDVCLLAAVAALLALKLPKAELNEEGKVSMHPEVDPYPKQSTRSQYFMQAWVAIVAIEFGN